MQTGRKRDPMRQQPGQKVTQHPHRACLVHIATVPLLHGPQVCILLLQAVLKLLDTPGCCRSKVVSQLHVKLRSPPTHLNAKPHLLLLSAGGSSSSMYSRFRCSSRSASCSFCLGAGDKQWWWLPRHSQLARSAPARPQRPLCLPHKHRVCVLWPLHLLHHQSHNPPAP